MERRNRSRPGSIQLLTRQGKWSHLGPLLCPGGDGWGEGLPQGWERGAGWAVGPAGQEAEPEKQSESFGHNLMAFPSAEVRGFL